MLNCNNNWEEFDRSSQDFNFYIQEEHNIYYYFYYFLAFKKIIPS